MIRVHVVSVFAVLGILFMPVHAAAQGFSVGHRSAYRFSPCGSDGFCRDLRPNQCSNLVSSCAESTQQMLPEESRSSRDKNVHDRPLFGAHCTPTKRRSDIVQCRVAVATVPPEAYLVAASCCDTLAEKCGP